MVKLLLAFAFNHLLLLVFNYLLLLTLFFFSLFFSVVLCVLCGKFFCFLNPCNIVIPAKAGTCNPEGSLYARGGRINSFCFFISTMGRHLAGAPLGYSNLF